MCCSIKQSFFSSDNVYFYKTMLRPTITVTEEDSIDYGGGGLVCVVRAQVPLSCGCRRII